MCGCGEAASRERPTAYLLFFDQKNIHTTLFATYYRTAVVAPFVEPMCVSGHCAPQPRFYSAIVWGAYDMW
eukprot:COSAG01_NODE_50519_length_362_cov_3.832700_1_plen_70_part_10